MARPKKDNADYFSHDSDMRNDPKVRALRRKYSFEGYAIWCFMLELLTDCDFFCYEWSEFNIELLAGDFDCESEKLTEIINYCIKLDLLQLSNENKISSLQHRKRFSSLLSKRKRDRSRVSDSENSISVSENPQSKVKESKVNNSKEKEIIIKDILSFFDFDYENENHNTQKSNTLGFVNWLIGNNKLDYFKGQFEAYKIHHTGGQKKYRHQLFSFTGLTGNYESGKWQNEDWSKAIRSINNSQELNRPPISDVPIYKVKYRTNTNYYYHTEEEIEDWEKKYLTPCYDKTLWSRSTDSK